MKTKSTPCNPEHLRLLVEDRLPPGELDRLEQHLAECAGCRRELDGLTADDNYLTAARRFLGPELTGPDAEFATAEESLDFLAPSDWPDSLGRLGAYEVKGVLGRGGMGVVLKAFDPALSRNVAIKVLAPSLANSGAARRRFLREARAAAAVVHEHVVGVFAVVESAGLPFLVMEYVPGRSLQERLDKHGPLSLPEVLRIGMQTAAGLAAAHAQGLVHRDVKPANILLENGVERVRLTDFGLARAAADAALTHSGIVAGTPHYMAPEQASGETIDHRADLFSLGGTLYAMCAGYPPFRAETPLAVIRRVCDHRPRPLREINPEVPAWLDAIVTRLIAKEPSRRFQTAGEVAYLLGRCLAHVQQPLSSPLPAELAAAGIRDKTRRLLRHKKRIVAMAAALLCIAMPALLPRPDKPSVDSAQRLDQRAIQQESQTTGPSLSVPSNEEIAREIREAWFLAGRIEAGIQRPRRGAGEDAVSTLASDLTEEVRALENEIAPAAPPFTRMRPSVPFANPLEGDDQ